MSAACAPEIGPEHPLERLGDLQVQTLAAGRRDAGDQRLADQLVSEAVSRPVRHHDPRRLSGVEHVENEIGLKLFLARGSSASIPL